MEETSKNLTAITSEFGDERTDGRVGVTIRSIDGDIDFLSATTDSESWTRAASVELLTVHGYEVIGDWSDIGTADPIWEATVTRTGPQADVATDIFGEFTAVECNPEQAVEWLFGIECDDDCPECNPA
ncbi:hypothetical protein KZO37_21455 [Rhodococcus fascians]|uniref:hypothetical protein n=1 Tax=Rhodococcoides fascians TaxID=1828 RepID=UPI001C6051D5|nr:hypothetical protein [Rhodococcus fascians]MBW4781932.1 hypothetical protein [Rhodococcus fascians]